MKTRNPLISFLITHYNRPNDLLKCITAIQEINILSYEIIVSDDASDVEYLELLETYNINRLITSEINQGLAANINKGLKACNGKYIIYCQEDFILSSKLKHIIGQCINLLDSDSVDMIRFTSNVDFKGLKKVTDEISLIPKFSFKNVLLNFYRYSDHPFITKKSFYDNFGYYLEGTSGRYGESEYAIRICNSKAKIAITNRVFAHVIKGSKSMLAIEPNVKKKNYQLRKNQIRVLRAIRLYFEWVFYRKTKRGLITYKNARKMKHA